MVDGLLTGLHDRGASHIDLLVSVAGRRLVEEMYAETTVHGYLWHELGDSMLMLGDSFG